MIWISQIFIGLCFFFVQLFKDTNDNEDSKVRDETEDHRHGKILYFAHVGVFWKTILEHHHHLRFINFNASKSLLVHYISYAQPAIYVSLIWYDTITNMFIYANFCYRLCWIKIKKVCLSYQLLQFLINKVKLKRLRCDVISCQSIIKQLSHD